MRPFGSLIAIDPISLDETITKSGVIITSQATEHRIGKVIAVGPDVSDDVKVGLYLLYEKVMGVKCPFEGREIMFVHENAAFGITDDYKI